MEKSSANLQSHESFEELAECYETPPSPECSIDTGLPLLASLDHGNGHISIKVSPK